MSTIKVFKKGESLIREGEKAHTIYFIQAGSVSVHLTRGKNNVDLCALGSNQIVGEHALAGVASHPHSVVATSETKAIELPVDAVRGQIEQSSQLMKFIATSMANKLKVAMNDLKSLKLAGDNTPCPPDQTAKIFGTVFHVARSKGEAKDGGAIVVSWPAMKQYAQRVFLEPPKRLEMAVNIFVKLGLARYEMVKNEEEEGAPLEIGFVHFSDLPLIEQFFEFYQYYYFKGGKQELLRTDDRVMQMVATLLEIGAGEQLDRHGSVRLDYSKMIERFREMNGYQLNADHFTNLENKGLFVKRQSTDQGVFLHFDYREFERTSKVWRVLREVERWNEKGSVDPNEPIDSRRAQKSGPCCPGCSHPYEGSPKFCSECGHKLVAAA